MICYWWSTVWLVEMLGRAFSPIVVIIQMWKNNTNFLDSGPYIDLPAYHPIRLFNIFIGGLYIVVSPFVYLRIFRLGTKNWDALFWEHLQNLRAQEYLLLQTLRARYLQDQCLRAALSPAVIQKRKKHNLVGFCKILMYTQEIAAHKNTFTCCQIVQKSYFI